MRSTRGDLRSMDLDIDTVRVARTRADCALRPGEAFLGGGTFLYSEPVRPGVTGLVDLMGLGWEPWSVDGSGLRVAGTCTLAELVAGPGALGAPAGDRSGAPGPYRGLGIVGECVSALSLSAKVARTATVGGNLALGLPAGSMVGLFVALDARAVVWTPDGGSRELPVADLVTGAGRVDLAPGELLREVRVPCLALGARTVFRRASLTPTGRTAAMVTGRALPDGAGSDSAGPGGDGPGRVLLVMTASTPVPHAQLVRAGDHDALDHWIDSVDVAGGWYEDTHGTADWRAAMTRRLAHEALDELGGGA
ncbi:FAD binding domain-containing protein [Promicromonospora sp. NPDC060204]|uniref:FAD binding domain-containing protein n=1 Tax=Promicromonospora sp. NPDC060204 TaxID=3347071 RepID=UPI003667EDF7